MANPLELEQKVSRFDTEHAAGALVLSALAFLIVVRRGFRGVLPRLGG